MSYILFAFLAKGFLKLIKLHHYLFLKNSCFDSTYMHQTVWSSPNYRIALFRWHACCALGLDGSHRVQPFESKVKCGHPLVFSLSLEFSVKAVVTWRTIHKNVNTFVIWVRFLDLRPQYAWQYIVKVIIPEFDRSHFFMVLTSGLCHGMISCIR